MFFTRKRLTALLLVLFMMIMTANATFRAIRVVPTLTFSGSTATCEVVITDSGKVIDAAMDLWCGNTLIDSWSGSSTSRLILSGTHNVVSGQKYTLTVSGNINGVTFDGPSISKTCP